MTNSETKQTTTTSFEDYIDNQVYYNTAKEELINAVNNNINTIILVGSGSNGKTYLTNDLHDHLNMNNYSTYQDSLPFLGEDVSNFNAAINSITGKKVLHSHFNPFERWNITMPPTCQIISMQHIKF